MKSYGTITFSEPDEDFSHGNIGEWTVKAEPHVVMRLKRVFGKVATHQHSEITIADTPENCRDLEWFLLRYPMDVDRLDLLTQSAAKHRETARVCEELIAGEHVPSVGNLAMPLRHYQASALGVYLQKGTLLLADEVGLGKTAVAIGSFCDPRTLPAAYVTLSHLPRQVKNQIAEFAPHLRVHVPSVGHADRGGDRAEGHDVIVLNYHKLAGWASWLAQRCKSVVFDECQELRHDGTLRYEAAHRLAAACRFRLGLSATPIYNYGGEMFNVGDAIQEGILGTREEFLREWCPGLAINGKPMIANPRAFGAYLRENCIMLRRTRHDVGRELPALTRIPHAIDSDPDKLESIKGNAVELARIILQRADSTRQERYVAAGQFDMLMRQATGLAKAPYVAEFVRMLIESGEKVILFGWHRDVYDVWGELLKEHRPVWFTGSESAAGKSSSVESFMQRGDGHSNVMFMSLRAGAGIDGLQKVCRTVVFGELDWSPGVHEQCIGRVHRDGQPDPVMAYFLVAEDGSDPVMAQVNGLKRAQVEGIRNPAAPEVEAIAQTGKEIRQLAETYLAQQERKTR